MAYLVCPCLTAIRFKRIRLCVEKDTSGLLLNRVRPSHSFTPPPPHLPPSPPPCLPPIFPPSLLPLRKFDSVLSSLFGMRLALRILRPHSLTLTVSLSLSYLSSLSPLSLSLSLLSVSRLSVSLLSLLSQEDPGKEPHIKDSSPLPPKRAPCFFLPRCPPLSHSGALAFAPPLASSDSHHKKTLIRINNKIPPTALVLVCWFPGRLVLWSLCPGPLVPWSLGPSVPLVLWSLGPLIPWSSGPLVLWSFGPSSWSSGPLGLYFRGKTRSR